MLSSISHLLCAWFAFALPCYSTFKALAHSASADTVHALATYWVVVGAFITFEQTLGLFLSWLPFYWELRTIFLLYISLPQTNGSAYVYKSLLEPWFFKNELNIDRAMASAQSNSIAFCRSRITALVELVRSLLNKTPVDGSQSTSPLDDLWAKYAPSVFAAFAPKDKDA